LENEITAAVNNEYSCSTSGGYANNEEKEKKMVEGSSSSLNCQQYVSLLNIFGYIKLEV